MKTRHRRRGAAALCTLFVAASLAMPAHAGGWGVGLGWSPHRYHHGYYGHSGYYGHHGYHGHHRHGHSSGDGWWAAGILALVGAGIYLAANANRDRTDPPYSVPYSPSYSATDPPPYDGYGDPAYPDVGAVPQGFPVTPDSGSLAASAEPPSSGSSARPGQAMASQAAAGARTDCRRAAINHSGYDPASASRWTTQVAVDAYQRALQSCLAGQAG